MAKLILKYEDRALQEFAIGAEEVQIGRLPDNAVLIDNPAVSSRHASVMRVGDSYIVKDLASTNGTFVNDTPHAARTGRMFQARFLHVGWLIIAPCAVGLAAQLAGDEVLSRLAGERLASKLAAIEQNGLTEAHEPRLTTLTEQEINAYLQFQGRAGIPASVTDAHIAIEGDGRVLGRAKVDLAQVREQSSGGWLDPLSYLSGSLLILASGVLYTGDGIGRLEIDTVTVGGVSVPTWVLHEMVRHYSRTAEHADGVNLDDAFELPSRIREIRVDQGEAVIVQ